MTQEQVKEEKKKGIFSKLKEALRTKKNNSPYFLRLLDWVS